MTQAKVVACWICGGNANSAEHLIKKSDLKAIFGHVTQDKPIYINSNNQRNVPIRGLKSDKLKFSSHLCSNCNNAVTQSHDKAWEKMSDYLRNRNPPILAGQMLRLQKIFPGAVQTEMLNIHLFFVKLFGCMIVEHNIPITDIAGLSNSILKNKPHPHVHLSFGTGFLQLQKRHASRSQVLAANINGETAFATWYYLLDKIVVQVIYALPSEHRQALINSWHPNSMVKRIQYNNLNI